MNENQNHREEMSAEERSRARTAFIRRRAAQQTNQINSRTEPKESTIMNTRTRTVLASLATIAAVLAFTPLATSAIANSGVPSFCVRASMEDGKYTADKGLCKPSEAPVATDPMPSNLTGRFNVTGVRIDSVTLTWRSAARTPATFKIGITEGANGGLSKGNLNVASKLVEGTTDTYTATIPLDAITAINKNALGGTSTIGVAGGRGDSGWVRANLKIALLGVVTGSSVAPI